jgi:hypothetical protein
MRRERHSKTRKDKLQEQTRMTKKEKRKEKESEVEKQG